MRYRVVQKMGRGVIEELREPDAHSEAFLDGAQQADRLDGGPAGLLEVGMGIQRALREIQDFLPQGQDGFAGPAGCTRRKPWRGGWQGIEIHFAAGLEGKLLYRDEALRYLVVAQMLGKLLAQCVQPYLRGQCDIGDQLPFRRQPDRRLQTPRLHQGAFDFLEFHAKSADLHLPVQTSQEMKIAVGIPFDDVSSLVEAAFIHFGAKDELPSGRQRVAHVPR